MGRLLLFLLGFLIVAGIGYWYVVTPARRAPEAPSQTLENTREAARRIEVEGAQRAADLDRAAAAEGAR